MADEAAGFAPGQLRDVRVLLLGQHGAAGGVRVAQPAEAELFARPQHDLLADARQVHPEQGQIEQRLGHEVAVGDRVEGVLEASGEPQLGGHAVRVEFEGRAGQSSRP